jgi:hypothetical protein
MPPIKLGTTSEFKDVVTALNRHPFAGEAVEAIPNPMGGAIVTINVSQGSAITVDFIFRMINSDPAIVALNLQETDEIRPANAA